MVAQRKQTAAVASFSPCRLEKWPSCTLRVRECEGELLVDRPYHGASLAGTLHPAYVSSNSGSLGADEIL